MSEVSEPTAADPGFAAGDAPAAAAPATPPQVCREVERVLPRQPHDRVKCAHLFGDYYRCNWWSRLGPAGSTSGYDWAGLLTDHIRKSCFLRVRGGVGGLAIEELANVPAAR